MAIRGMSTTIAQAKKATVFKIDKRHQTLFNQKGDGSAAKLISDSRAKISFLRQ
jgi:hypothetical protein